MRAGTWGAIQTCRCGSEVQHFTPFGQGWPIRIEVESGLRHRCPTNAPRYEDYVLCECGQVVRQQGVGGPKYEFGREQPHVCRKAAEKAPEPVAKPVRNTKPVASPAPALTRGVIEL